MFENVSDFFKKLFKKEKEKESNSGKEAKERLHLVLMQDRANVSADFLEMMKQEIIEVIKKYIDVDENSIDVRLTNQQNDDGTNGAPALYANIPIMSIKEEKKENVENNEENKDNTKDLDTANKDNNNEKEEGKHAIDSTADEESKQEELVNNDNNNNEETNSEKSKE